MIQGDIGSGIKNVNRCGFERGVRVSAMYEEVVKKKEGKPKMDNRLKSYCISLLFATCQSLCEGIGRVEVTSDRCKHVLHKNPAQRVRLCSPLSEAVQPTEIAK